MTTRPGRVPGSWAIVEPHSGQKCRSIGFPLPPGLVNVFVVPSIVQCLPRHIEQSGECTACESLAVSAMADARRQWFSRCPITHRAAEATALQLRHYFL